MTNGQKRLIPIIKLPEQKTWSPWLETGCKSVIIKAQDLVNPSGLSPNQMFELVKSAGGLHKFIGFDGEIILSSVMPDKTIFGLKKELYAKIILACKPDCYFTPDAETYFDRVSVSAKEINRIQGDFIFLLDACPDSIPIGLVKGANLQQVKEHMDFLFSKGVIRFVFHAGDYVCRGSMNSLTTARHFAREISACGHLIVYGTGSKKQLKLFHFADEFATQSHYVQAFYGNRLEHGKTVKIKGGVTRSDVMQNLKEIKKNLESLEPTELIFKWIFPEKEKAKVKEKLLLNQKSLVIEELKSAA